MHTEKPIALENQIDKMKQYVSFPKRTRMRNFLKRLGNFTTITYGKYIISLACALKCKPTQDLLYQVYDFDVELRGLLFKYCNRAEVQFKSHVSNALTLKTNDVTFYLNVYDNNIYAPSKGEKDKNTRYKNKKYFEKASRKIVAEERDMRNKVFKHPEFADYRKGGALYRQKIPAWAYFSKIDFGSFVTIYSYLNLSLQKSVLAYGYSGKRYDKNITKNVDSWLNAIRNLRNICAHNAKIVGMKSTEIAIDKNDNYNILNSREGLFAKLYALKKILNREDAHKLKIDLQKLIKNTRFDVYKMRILPKDWETRYDAIEYL